MYPITLLCSVDAAVEHVTAERIMTWEDGTFNKNTEVLHNNGALSTTRTSSKTPQSLTYSTMLP